VAEVGDELPWQGKADHYIVSGEEDGGDQVFLEEHPFRAAFIQMTQLPGIQEVQEERLAALECTAVMASTSVKSIFELPEH